MNKLDPLANRKILSACRDAQGRYKSDYVLARLEPDEGELVLKALARVGELEKLCRAAQAAGQSDIHVSLTDFSLISENY